MKAVGEVIPSSFKKTAKGGLAATATAIKLSAELSD
jgi:hypothetical protein